MVNQCKIKVSVCVVTYNQEEYISECLRSLVDQKTDFPFEIIVGEDCSTDSTREIIEEFRIKYPELIVRNYQDKNVGAVKNAITSYKMARGEYICHMDGDDGALPEKLQKTVEILDANPECIMITHDAIVINKNSEKIRNSLKKFKTGIYEIEDLIRNLPFFTNSTKMVRRQACIDSLELLHENAIDVELHLLESRFGKIIHIDTPLGYYREMTGISSENNRVNPLIVEGYSRAFSSLLLGDVFKTKIKIGDIEKIYARSILNFAYQSVYFGDYFSARKYCIKSLRIRFFSLRQLLVFGLSFFGFLSKCLILIRSKLKNKYISDKAKFIFFNSR